MVNDVKNIVNHVRLMVNGSRQLIIVINNFTHI